MVIINVDFSWKRNKGKEKIERKDKRWILIACHSSNYCKL